MPQIARWMKPGGRCAVAHTTMGGMLCLLLVAFGVAGTITRSAAGQGGIPCAGYEISEIIQAPPCGIFGFLTTAGTAISPNGAYVCGYTASCALDGNSKAWVFKTATNQLIMLPLLPGVLSARASDVSDSGLVVGEMGGSAGDFGFIWDLHSDQYVLQLPPIDPDGGCEITAINSSNVVCGTRMVDATLNRTTAFRWSKDKSIEDLGLIGGMSTTGVDINEMGTVTGQMHVNGIPHPFLWRGDELLDLGELYSQEAVPFGMNNLDQVVGRQLVPPSLINHGFVASKEAIQELFPLPGHIVCSARLISDDGLVGGHSLRKPGGSDGRGCLWISGTVVDINMLIDADILIRNLGDFSSDGHLLGHSNDGRAVVLVPQLLQGDVDRNCVVDVNDLLGVIGAWGHTSSPADFNGDGIVDMFDLLIVILNWTTG